MVPSSTTAPIPMATTTKSNFWFTTISQVNMLKQAMKRWSCIKIKSKALLISSNESRYACSGSAARIPSGFLAIYVGRFRFLIPTRFLKLPVLIALPERSAEDYGFQSRGGIELPCEVDLLNQVLKFLEQDEKKYGMLGLDEFLRLVSEAGLDPCCSCKASSSHRDFRTALLIKS